MILPLGLGHKHIKTSFISWFVIISFGLSFIYKKDINISIAEIVLVTLLVLSMAPYVEMRMGRLLTFLFSMTIGVASGKLVLNEPNYVNFFAVASWYSGAYFSLFYLRDFKWAIWKVWGWKYFSVSSGLVVPFLYVFAWWGYVFSSHSPDYIHNFLPISSFLFGLFTGHVYRRKNPIPLGFLYQFEWNRWKSLSKRNVNTKKMVSVAKVILDFNPMNIKVQYDICKKIVLDLKNEPINEN
ncbi:MAG: hypothetical protein KDD58_08695, partial [Bdellovibrionales bacterium]|nr:hypothetical protein [Bdellovibrionales bacterium]